MKKRISLFITIFMLTILIGGCGESGVSKKYNVEIEELEWKVEESIIDGKRKPCFEYKNNSKYVVTEFEIKFKQKSEVTKEEKDKFFKEIFEYLKYDKLNDDNKKQLDELKEKEISMHVKLSQIVKTGETSEKEVPCYFEGSYYVKNIEHYNLVTPDIATIKYIDGENIVTVYYDFNNKKYTEDSEKEVAFYWQENELSKLVSKPKAEVVKDSYSSDKKFDVEICGWKQDDFKNYAEECKSKGFNKDVKFDDDVFEAKNDKGNSIRLHYHDYSNEVDLTIKKYEDE